MINAAIHGGWWLALPLAFYWVASLFEARLGDDERNMDPERTPEERLFWYKLPVWMWAVLWPGHARVLPLADARRRPPGRLGDSP